MGWGRGIGEVVRLEGLRAPVVDYLSVFENPHLRMCSRREGLGDGDGLVQADVSADPRNRSVDAFVRGVLHAVEGGLAHGCFVLVLSLPPSPPALAQVVLLVDET